VTRAAAARRNREPCRLSGLYGRQITELWAGRPIPADILTEDFVGNWPDRDVHGPDELQQTDRQTRNMVADFDSHPGPPIDVGPIEAGYSAATASSEAVFIP
jgi:hypothetical protein